MNSAKKMRLDAEEKEIEKHLDISKQLSPKKKAQELVKLKAAAQDHLRKKSKEKTQRLSIKSRRKVCEQLQKEKI